MLYSFYLLLGVFKITEMKYEYLSEIVEQIEKCNFTDENGSSIKNNKAFKALKEHSICDGMRICDCKRNSNNYLCDDCLDRVYQSHQG